MFLSLLTINLLEFIGLSIFILFDTLTNMEIFLRFYYVGLYWCLASFLLLSYSTNKASIQFARIILYTSATLLSLATLLTDWIVAGVVPIAYSVTRIKGEYYPLFQIFLTACMVLSITNLILALRAKDAAQRRWSATLLLAISPLTIITGYVVLSMALGGTKNMTLLGSIATSLLLIIIVYSNSDKAFFKPLTRLISRISNT